MITVEEGRKVYNELRVGRLSAALEVHTMKSHDAAVEEFFAQCAVNRPAETARVFAQYPVLTERQLDDRRARELHAFGPEEDQEDEAVVASVTTLASLVATRDEQERVRLARLRGEPV